ncbi:MAG: hypothetical protein V3S55_09325 [Nitrospiraceae bacterium]
MPQGNNFQHANYSRSNPGDRALIRQFEPGAPPDSLAWRDAMGDLGRRMGAAGVRTVLFMHGTVLGTDPFGMQRLDEAGGLRRGYSRGIPGLEALLALMRAGSNGLPSFQGGQKPPLHDDDQTKKLIDDQAGDACNFTAEYVGSFHNAVNRDATRSLICQRFLWCCEHHHLGRARAALALLHHLRTLCQESHLGAGDRILVQAHGQAGLVVALLSNLLAPGGSSGRTKFLQALKLGIAEAGGENQRSAGLGDIEQLESLLQTGQALNSVSLDVVTFGTSVRYGWDTAGLGRLLHLVNHRPMRGDGKQWLAKMELPQITMEMPITWGGDYIQQLAVAGSDAVPTTPKAQAANRALWELLEPYDGFERWLECARKSVRCANDGACLLVDYQDAGSTTAWDHVYGHAAYTRLNALLFNTTEIVRALYTPPSSS